MGDNFSLAGMGLDRHGWFHSVAASGEGVFSDRLSSRVCPFCFPLCPPLAHLTYFIILLRGKAISSIQVLRPKG